MMRGLFDCQRRDRSASHRGALAALVAAGGAIGIVSASLASLAAQQPSKSASLTTLRGCVTSDATNKRNMVLSDADGQSYSLKGLSVRDFLGKRVEITGAPSKLRIVGGLYPNPNVAAQGGAYDPVKAAMAAQTPSNQPAKTIDFRVKSVRAVEGACPE